MRRPDLSVKTRILLAFGVTSIALLAGFYLVAGMWYQNNQLERMDNFLITEASGIELTLSSMFSLSDKTSYMESFLEGYMQHRANRPLPYKTTLVIMDTTGTVLAQSNHALDLMNEAPPEPEKHMLKTLSAQGMQYRIIQKVIMGPDGSAGEIRIGCLIDETLETIRTFNATLGVSMVAILLGLIAGSIILVTLILKPVARITREVRQITRFNLHDRVHAMPGHDELANLSVTLNQTLDSLEKTWSSQEDFINAMAHQLRTPLASMRGTMELALEKTADPVQVHKALTNAILETDHLSGLVSTLLHLARLDNQSALTQSKPVQVINLVMEILDDLSFLWQEKHIHLSFGMPDPMEPQLIRLAALDTQSIFMCAGDPLQLKQVFMNILDNAARFLPQTGGTLQVIFSITRHNRQDFCQVSLENNGPNLKPDKLEAIFQRFQHDPQTAKPEQAGFGLGLSIARRIMELHGGSVQAYIPPQGGAGFRVAIPTLTRD